ncbi:MAG: hypothetical protein AMJ81_01120 [Phycisphaerae bacterium SM23_33]|nr:MAG: hypothetical protein AMJ81_01120 [Phycisphaerae bacterium SM23_33]
MYGRSRARIGFNMTAMIDCTFQLIIFFMLTTQMASAEFPPMKLPDPHYSVAAEMKENKAVINVMPYSDREIQANPSKLGLARVYRVKKSSVLRADLERLVAELRRLKIESPDPDNFAVEVRADQRVHYDQIQPVLQALQEARLQNMRISALRGRKEE